MFINKRTFFEFAENFIKKDRALITLWGVGIISSGRYLLFQKAEAALLEEKAAKLFGLARVLDQNLQGTYEQLLEVNRADRPVSAMDREEKIIILSRLLYPFTDLLAASFPRVGVGYYSRELDAILTYGPGSSYQDRVGVSVDSDHIGRKAMARRREIMGVGSMVRGEIMNCVRPLVRDGDVIGFVWANETIEDIYRQIDRGARQLFFSSDIQPILGLTGLLLFCSKFLVLAKAMEGHLPWTIRHIQHYLMFFLNSLHTGIILVDSTGSVVFVNRGLGEILRFDPSALPAEYHRDYRVFLDRIGFKEVGAIAEGLLADNRRQYFSKSSLLLPGGHIKELNYIIALLSGEGLPEDVPGKVILFEDLEGSKEEEKRLERANKLATLGELAASLAHEIRNPLSIVLGSLQLLPRRFGDREFVYSFLRVATQELIRVNNSIESLLDFTRFSTPDFELVDINSLMQSTLEFFSVTMESSGIKLESDLAPGLPQVEADGKQIKQALLNIILNSINAMPGGGKLKVSTHHLPGDRFIRIVIADTGTGIQEEHRPYVFDAFYSTKEKGTGLGLSLVHRVIDEHQGIIEFNSRVNKGTTFYLHLPVKQFSFGSCDGNLTSGRELL